MAVRAWSACIFIVAACALPARADAFPVLRLFLPGDAQSVAEGGSAVFADPRAAALRLERPALLSQASRGFLAVGIEGQSIVEIRRDRFEGTFADDHASGMRAVIPLHVDERRVAVGASFEHQSALARLDDAKNGLEIALSEGRGVGVFGVGGEVFPNLLSVGASAQVVEDAGLGYTVEARFTPLPWLAVSAREGLWRSRYLLTAPALNADKLDLPPLTWDLYHAQPLTEGLVELGTPELGMLLLRGDARTPHSGYAEIISPASWLTVRGALERNALQLDDFVSAAGAANVARAGLDLTRTRALAGADIATEWGTFRARYVRGTIEARMGMRELGNGASQALTDADLQLDLYARTSYRLRTDQVSLGWSQKPGPRRFLFSAGVQFLEVSSGGDVAYGAEQLDIRKEDTLDTATMDLVAATFGVQLRLSERFSLRYAFAQFVPLSLQSEQPSPWLPVMPEENAPPMPGQPPPGEPPSPPAPSGPTQSESIFKKLKDGMKSYGGGNFQVLQIVHEF